MASALPLVKSATSRRGSVKDWTALARGRIEVKTEVPRARKRHGVDCFGPGADRGQSTRTPDADASCFELREPTSHLLQIQRLQLKGVARVLDDGLDA